MTPEREYFNRQVEASRRHLQAGQKELVALLSGAEEFGLILSIEHRPGAVPAMGNFTSVGSVRLSRARQRELAALQKAAEESEQHKDPK